MAIAENHVRPPSVAEMAIRLIGAVIDIIPFLQHRIFRRGRALPRINLRRIGKQSSFRRTLDLAQVDCWLPRRGGEVQVVAITIGCAGGLQFQLREKIIKSRAQLDSSPSQVRIEGSLDWIERAFSLRARADPAEPVKLSA